MLTCGKDCAGAAVGWAAAASGRDSGGMLAVVGFSLMCNSYHWVVTLMSSVQRLLLYEEGNSWCCQTVVYYCYECNYH